MMMVMVQRQLLRQLYSNTSKKEEDKKELQHLSKKEGRTKEDYQQDPKRQTDTTKMTKEDESEGIPARRINFQMRWKGKINTLLLGQLLPKLQRGPHYFVFCIREDCFFLNPGSWPLLLT